MLHSQTLLMLATILVGVVAIVVGVMWFFNRQIPGLRAWALSYCLGFGFCVSFLLQSQLPQLPGVLITQTLMFLAAWFNLVAARSHTGKRPLPLRHIVFALAGLLALVVFFTAFHPSPSARLTLSSLASGSVYLLCAQAIASGGFERYPIRYLLAGVYGVHGLFILARPWLYTPSGPVGFGPVQAMAIPELIILESIIAMMLLGFGCLMLSNEFTNHQLRRLAERDALTDVFNRRSFMLLLDKAMSRASRKNGPLAVLMVDLDHFKSINDSWGHKVGDDALRHFVEIATQCLRNDDIIGRIGGEEFAILLPDSNLEGASRTASRLRALIANTPLQHNMQALHITASIGVASALASESAETLLDRADQAMYRAKQNGRNRVEAQALDVLASVAAIDAAKPHRA